jgi:hypothetical protein
MTFYVSQERHAQVHLLGKKDVSEMTNQSYLTNAQNLRRAWLGPRN